MNLPPIPRTGTFRKNPPQALVLHGDVFDWVEKFPEDVKNFLVYYFAPDKQPDDYALGQMYDFVRRTTPSPTNPAYIQCAAPAKLGALQSPDEPTLPAWFNVQQEGVAGADVQYLDSAWEQAKEANAAYPMNLKVVIIGHTHHARIAVREDGGNLFPLIDCGAWIENCSVDGTAADPLKNAQIAALCDNEARIYQLAPNGG